MGLSRSASVAALAIFAAACGTDGSVPGVREACVDPSGEPLGCESIPIESPEDACWRLVGCAAIPIANPEDQPDCCFDYPTCVNFFERIDAVNRDFALRCVETTACDQLRWNGSPDRPARERNQMPLCLQHGDQP